MPDRSPALHNHPLQNSLLAGGLPAMISGS